MPRIKPEKASQGVVVDLTALSANSGSGAKKPLRPTAKPKSSNDDPAALSPKLPTTSTWNASATLAQAKNDWSNGSDSLVAGEIVEIISRGNWWNVKNNTGKTFYVSSSILVAVSGSGVSSASSSSTISAFYCKNSSNPFHQCTDYCKQDSSSSSLPAVQKGTVLFDFEAEDKSELSLRKGDVVIIEKADESEDWFFVHKESSRLPKGWFPANYLQREGSNSALGDLLKDLAQF
jgi:hypothetical protein